MTHCRGERGAKSPKETGQRKKVIGTTPRGQYERGKNIVPVQITSIGLFLTTNYFCNGPRPTRESKKLVTSVHGARKGEKVKENMLPKQVPPPYPSIKLIGERREASLKMKRRANRDEGITETGLHKAKVSRQCNESAILQADCTSEPSDASRDYQNLQDKEPYTKCRQQ